MKGKLYAVTHFMQTQMRRSTFHVIISIVEPNILLKIIVGQGWLSVKMLSKKFEGKKGLLAEKMATQSGICQKIPMQYRVIRECITINLIHNQRDIYFE